MLTAYYPVINVITNCQDRSIIYLLRKKFFWINVRVRYLFAIVISLIHFYLDIASHIVFLTMCIHIWIQIIESLSLRSLIVWITICENGRNLIFAGWNVTMCVSLRIWMLVYYVTERATQIILVHLSIRTTDYSLRSGTSMLYWFVFAFHNLHDFSEELLVLIVYLLFTFAVVWVAEELNMRVPLRAGLVNWLLHISNSVYHILVVLSENELLWHIPIVVNAVFLRG